MTDPSGYPNGPAIPQQPMVPPQPMVPVRRESKVPLILTLIGLTVVVVMAYNYIQDHKRQQAVQQAEPVYQASTPAPTATTAPPAPVAAAPSPQQQQAAAPGAYPEQAPVVVQEPSYSTPSGPAPIDQGGKAPGWKARAVVQHAGGD